MTDIGLISYYLGIGVKQEGKDILITLEGYVKEVLKKFKMGDSNLIGTPMESGICFLSIRKEIRWIPLSIKV